MTISKAITTATREFERTTGKEKKAEIRNVYLQEGSGQENEYSQIVIKIEYAIDGDYRESDKNPFYVKVIDYGFYNNCELKKVIARKIKLDF